MAKNTFTVKESLYDTEAPVVTEITFDKTTAGVGDVVTVKAKASDASRIYGVTVRLREKGNEKSGTFYVNLAQYDDGEIKNQIAIDDMWNSGMYEIVSVTASDELGNSVTYDNESVTRITDVKRSELKVSGSGKNVPWYLHLEFDKNQATLDMGDEITVITDADKSVTDHFDLYIKNSSTGLIKKIVLKTDTNGKVTGTIKLDDTFDNGKYSIYKLEYYKEADKPSLYYWDFDEDED